MTALLPYPYKMFPSDSLSDGSIFHIPTFCKQNYSSCKCQQFYNNCVSEGIKQCPYGFAVDVFKVGGQTMILSCLNVDRISDKKAIQKRLRDRDFLPRIPYNSYIQSKTSICSLVEESSDFFQQESNFKKTKATYDEKTGRIEMIHGTLSEIAEAAGTSEANIKSLFGLIKEKIDGFFKDNEDNLEKCEFLLPDVLDEMMNNQRSSIKDIEERFIATVACKAAVKAGMDLSKIEVDNLIQDLLNLQNPYTCPHGRPTTVKFTKNGEINFI